MNAQHSNDFNWVKARAECRPAFVFDSLLNQVKKDVDQANQFHPSRNTLSAPASQCHATG